METRDNKVSPRHDFFNYKALEGIEFCCFSGFKTKQAEDRGVYTCEYTFILNKTKSKSPRSTEGVPNCLTE